MSKFTLAPPPHLFKDNPYALTWVNNLIARVSDTNAIEWEQIDLEFSDHDQLQGREEADPLSADTERNKHLSDNDLKLAQDHREATNAHDANGNIVGTNDYATTTIGGTVLQATTVADAESSAVSITSTDAGATYTTSEQALINELKADVNTLTNDLNAAIAQINALLAAQRTAKQLEI